MRDVTQKDDKNQRLLKPGRKQLQTKAIRPNRGNRVFLSQKISFELLTMSLGKFLICTVVHQISTEQVHHTHTYALSVARLAKSTKAQPITAAVEKS